MATKTEEHVGYLLPPASTVTLVCALIIPTNTIFTLLSNNYHG